MRRRAKLLKERKKENERRLEKTEHDLKREFADAGIRNFRTEARMKGVYSLYNKLERKNWDINQIYDILALRVIFPSVADCYSALGIIHAHWRPSAGQNKGLHCVSETKRISEHSYDGVHRRRRRVGDPTTH